MSYSPPTHVPRQETGPDTSQGQLSPTFTEVEIKVSSSFAHDAGTITNLDSLSVGGKDCYPRDVLQELVALRGGWTTSGESSDEAVKATLEDFNEAWGAVFPHAGRLTDETPPEHLKYSFGNSLSPEDQSSNYHPPRVELYALDDGDKLVVHSYFKTWDGGNHGRQLAYCVEAYRVSDGSFFDLSQEKNLGIPAETAGPQPVDPKIPRPARLTR